MLEGAKGEGKESCPNILQLTQHPVKCWVPDSFCGCISSPDSKMYAATIPAEVPTGW